MARVLAISTDLLLGSKVEAMLRAAGHEVTLAPSLPEQLENVDLIVADLDTDDPQALANLHVPVLGYYSHVNVETKKASEAAGIALAVPRSRMARELPKLTTKLLT
ncbi:MAG TPA: hypothetical protein VF245_06565 [Solirubrobacterales bacterium]